MAAATVEINQKLKFKLLPHQAYSSDLVSSNYNIFGPLRNALCR
jgi:hypothetical protein